MIQGFLNKFIGFINQCRSYVLNGGQEVSMERDWRKGMPLNYDKITFGDRLIIGWRYNFGHDGLKGGTLAGIFHVFGGR